MFDYFDHYPKNDDFQVNQERSKTKLRILLKEDRFIHQYPSHDSGIDVSLELRVDGKASACTGSAQLKSVQTASYNNDGSQSHQVELKTILYLLHSSSFFFLYLVEEDRMLWASNKEIVRFAQSQGIDLHQPPQQTISYRFSKELDSAAADEIFKDILNFSKAKRQIQEAVAISTPNASVLIDEKEDGFIITNLTGSIEQIKKYGFALINQGRISLIEEIISKLTNSAREDKDLAIIVSYANLMSGRPLETLHWLPTNHTSLNLNDKQLIQIIKTSANFSLGILNHKSFLERLKTIELEPGSLMSVQVRIQGMRSEIFLSKDRNATFESMAKFQEHLKEIRAQFRLEDNIQLLLEIYEVELEGYLINFNGSHGLTRHWAYKALGFESDLDGNLIALDIFNRSTEWLKKGEELLSRANELKNPLLQETIAFMGASFHFQQYFIARLAEIHGGGPTPPTTTIEASVQDLYVTVERCYAFCYFNLSLRAALLLYEMLQILGRTQESKRIAARAHEVAQTTGNEEEVKLAQAALNGEASVFSFQKHLKDPRDSASRLSLLEISSSEQKRSLALAALKLWGLPEVRIENAIRSVEAQYFMQQQWVAWCEFVNLIEFHANQRREHLYEEAPRIQWICSKLGFNSAVNENWTASFDEFKRSFCEGCSSRKPFDPKATLTEA